MNKHVYTKEQLDQMSDFDLNKAVAEKLGVYISKDEDDIQGVIVKQFNKIDKTKFIHVKADYLENYNDCMLIADKYGLVLKPALIKDNVVKKWSCNDRRFRPFSNGVSMVESVSIQPTIQRSIVYCFLIMEV